MPDFDFDTIFADSEEGDGEPTLLSGGIPADLRGTLLRNGPGTLRAGSDAVSFFDGYGFVAGLSFAEGRAFYRGRFVDTTLRREELAAGRMVRRRAFTNRPGGGWFDVKLGNPVMHEAFAWGGAVYAADDPGHQKLDGRTLATLGSERWGRVPGMDKMAPLPRVDVANNRLVAYAAHSAPFSADTIRFYEFDPAWNVVAENTHRIDRGFSFVHDVAFTDRYYVLVELAVQIALGSLLRGKKTLWECVTKLPGKPAFAHLVPRGGGPGRKVALPGGGAFFHIANAYDDGDDVVFCGPSYDVPDFGYFAPKAYRDARSVTKPAPIPSFARLRISPGGAVERTPLGDGMELPRVNPRFHGKKFRFAYLLAAGPSLGEPDPFVWSRCIGKVDVDTGDTTTWDAGPGRFLSQPAFAAREAAVDEDDGYVIAYVVDATAARTEAVVLDARRLADGPIATLRLPAFLGLASHCRFEPEVSLFP